MRNSKSIICAAVAVGAILGIGAASAADLPARTYTKAPVMVDPGSNWTGFYAGLNAGGGWGQNTINNTATNAGCLGGFVAPVCADFPLFIPTRLDTRPSGFVGGGQFGYNWQVRSYLLGVETDIQGSGIKGSQSASNTGIGPNAGFTQTALATASQRVDWFGTLRARVGWLPTNALLFYATGGLAYGGVSTQASFTETSSVGLGPTRGASALSQSSTRVGWAAGGGLEWMFAPRWSVKAEYLYYDLGAVGLNQTLLVADTVGPGIGVVGIRSDAHYRVNIARAGVNYHF